MLKLKKFVAAGCMAAGLSAGIGMAAIPAASASPVITGGLVNVTLTNVLNNTTVTVQLPIGVAANVCGIAANVLAQHNYSAPVSCTSSATLPVAFQH